MLPLGVLWIDRRTDIKIDRNTRAKQFTLFSFRAGVLKAGSTSFLYIIRVISELLNIEDSQ